ncbi:hypothetical protein FACS1894111_04880 [Clostridia bacterium]|nr:hypothetical protein FACS1894111_04880 [Clostridia bacterium]
MNTMSNSMNETFLHKFQKQAAKTPEALAVNDVENRRISYRQLNGYANHIARRLRDLGVQKGDAVAIFLERTAMFPAACIGVFKAGGAYVPLDPIYPPERISFILKDSKAKVLITSHELSKVASSFDGSVLYISDTVEENCDDEPIIDGSDINYIIYTSGTTGEPKGTINFHRGLRNLIDFYTITFEVTKNDIADVYSSFGFDASVFQIFPPLTKGAAIDIIPAELQLDLFALAHYYSEHRITISCLPPATAKLFEPLPESPLRLVLCGGDRATYVPNRNYTQYNLYGPTEASVCATSFLMKEHYDNMPIGKAIPNTELYIVNEAMERLSDGEEGELCIAGLSVAAGYLFREELTAEKFIKNPFSNDPAFAVLYRTGDLCRRLPDGNILFLGRIDTQVKIHGFRIELGEIEATLRTYPGVTDAICAAFDDGNGSKYINGYYTAETELSENKLKTFLSEKLPHYMIPSAIEKIEQIPLTLNGKFDRTALSSKRTSAAVELFHAKNDKEEVLFDALYAVLKTNALDFSQGFIDIGGDSISAMSLCAEVRKRGYLTAATELLDNTNTLSDVAATLRLIPKTTALRKCDSVYDLTPAQNGMLYHYMLDESTTEYINQVVYSIEGTLDIHRCRSAFSVVGEKFPVLKTAIIGIHTAQPTQQIMSERVIEVKGITLNNATIEKVLARDMSRGFDFENDTLFRVTLIREEENYSLLLSFPHIILDGWSVGSIMKTFSEAYEKLSGGVKLTELQTQAANWAQANLSYQEYVAYQKSLDHETSERYFTDLLADYETDTAVFKDDPNTERKRQNLEKSIDIPKSLEKEMEAAAKICRITPNVIYESVYALLLQKMCGSADVAFAKAVMGRNFPIENIENMAGLFINTIPSRIITEKTDTFASLFSRVQKQNNDSRFHEFVDVSAVQKHIPHNGTLFSTLFAYNPFFAPYCGFLSMRITKEIQTSNFDSVLVVEPEPGGTSRIRMQYNSYMFGDTTIEGFLEMYLYLLEQAVHTEKPLALVETLRDTTPVIALGKGTENNIWRDKTYPELFREQARRTPDQIALKDEEGTSLTYRELDNITSYLAENMRTLKVSGASPVAMFVNRTVLYPVAVLSILKAGLAYLPLDSSYPRESIAYMLEDSGTQLILTCDEYMQEAGSYGIRCLSVSEGLAQKDVETPFVSNSKTDDIAYMIYTSGSTGKPKGAMISQRNMVNYCLWSADTFGHDITTAATMSFSFDGSIEQIFPRLLTGGKVIVVNDTTRRDMHALVQLVEREDVTGLMLTTMLTKPFMEIYHGNSLKYLAAGGEKLTLSNLPKDYLLYNLYGPTEGTVVCNAFVVDTTYENIPIGKMTYNMQALILDENNKLLPVGALGQLAISGRQVSFGYWNKPQLSENVFIENPYAYNEDTKIMYLTGDLARILPNGNVLYYGRADSQVKVNGFRIELSGIETVMQTCPLIRDVVAVAQRDSRGNGVLCCYYTAKDVLEPDVLKQFALSHLPGYMVPTAFLQIAEIPLTANGKLNKRALPTIAQAVSSEYEAPVGQTEERLAEVYSQLLSIEKVSRGAEFFSIGGTSILAISAVAKLKPFYDISITKIFEYPVLKDLALVLQTQKKKVDGGQTDTKESLAHLEEKRTRYLETIENLDLSCVKEKATYQTILLTGATGYLGVYMAKELLTNYDVCVYAIVRAENDTEAAERVLEKMQYYFGMVSLPSKLTVYAGDMATEKFGLDDALYATLAEEVDVVVNAAALVKHYGHYEEFEAANVTAVRNLLAFCEERKRKDFAQTSTLSVAEGNVDGVSKVLFTEEDVSIGQHSDNYYVQTKLEAEKIVLSARENGLNTSIYRLGNITIDTQDHVLQQNIDENAFFRIFDGVVGTSVISQSLGRQTLSFVNQCADAICRLLFCENLKNGIYHIESDKVTDMLQTLTDLSVSLCVLEDDVFVRYLSDNLDRKDIGEYAEQILTHVGHLGDETTMETEIRSDKTLRYLSALDFVWKTGNDTILKNMVKRTLSKRISFLRSIPSFAKLSEDALYAFAGGMISRIYEENIYVRHEDKVYDELLLLYDGAGETFITSVSGWEGTVELVKKGEIIGIESLFHKRSVVTLESVFDAMSVYAISVERLNEVIDLFPEIAKAFTDLLGEKLSRSQRLWANIG